MDTTPEITVGFLTLTPSAKGAPAVWSVLPLVFRPDRVCVGVRDVLHRPIEVSGIEQGPKSDAI